MENLLQRYLKMLTREWFVFQIKITALTTLQSCAENNCAKKKRKRKLTHMILKSLFLKN